MLRKLIERWKSWHLRRDIEAGRVLRGRQPEKPGGVKAKAEPIARMKKRVYRAATDTWEEV